jgi:hypothetical protein
MKNYTAPGQSPPQTVSPSIPTTGTAGELTASSIVLTADQSVLSHGPIRLINKLVELDQYSGNGVPTFKANTGSKYYRNDVGQTYINTSASPGGTTWSLEAVSGITTVQVQMGLGLTPTSATNDKFPGTPVQITAAITGYTAYALTAGAGGTTVITVTGTNPAISRTISLTAGTHQASISGFTDNVTSATLYLPTVSTGGFNAANISLFGTGTQTVT